MSDDGVKDDAVAASTPEGRREPEVRLHSHSGEAIHLDKFMGGRMTPMEAHIRYAWGGRRCCTCNGAPVVRIAIFMPLGEAMQRAPEAVMKAAELNAGTIPSCEMSDGKRYVKASDSVFCSGCRRTALREAAHGLAKWSTCIVDVDEGPDEKRRPFIMVPASYREKKKA